MSLRKVIAHVKDANSDFNETFVEGERGSFPVGHADPEQWVRECMDRFNASLRQNETPRTILSMVVEAIEEKSVRIEHRWEKTNLVTIENRGQYYDTARCSECGITGKRFGVRDVKRDPKYGAKGYETCNGAKTLLKRRGDR